MPWYMVDFQEGSTDLGPPNPMEHIHPSPPQHHPLKLSTEVTPTPNPLESQALGTVHGEPRPRADTSIGFGTKENTPFVPTWVGQVRQGSVCSVYPRAASSGSARTHEHPMGPRSMCVTSVSLNLPWGSVRCPEVEGGRLLSSVHLCWCSMGLCDSVKELCT
jgi:hypothetical protein